MNKTGKLFKDLVDLMTKLRSKKGCPWDRKQTHRSLKTCLVDETCEILDSVDRRNYINLMEELGDLLYLIIFYAQIAKEGNEFIIDDVLKNAYLKLKRRHPHVFGEIRIKDPKKVIDHWNMLKVKEQKAKQDSIFKDMPRTFSALHKAAKFQRKIKAAGLGDIETNGSLKKMEKVLRDLKNSLKKKRYKKAGSDIGDLLFSIVSLSLSIDTEPEELLHRTTDKFIREFKRMERLYGYEKKI